MKPSAVASPLDTSTVYVPAGTAERLVHSFVAELDDEVVPEPELELELEAEQAKIILSCPSIFKVIPIFGWSKMSKTSFNVPSSFVLMSLIV